MKDTALYETLLGLQSPWSVKHVDLFLAEQRVVVEVVLKQGQVWADPTDSTKRAHINGWSERQWRHLDTCQFETINKARVPARLAATQNISGPKQHWGPRFPVALSFAAVPADAVIIPNNVWNQMERYRWPFERAQATACLRCKGLHHPTY